MLEETQEYLNVFGDEVVRLAQRNLNLQGFAGQKRNRKKNSTKGLSDSLTYEIREGNNGLVMEFGSDKNYAAIVEEGRKKGTFPNVSAIRKWIKEKPIQTRKIIQRNGVKINKFVPKTEKSINQAAFVIGRSIKENGIKPAPYFGDALDEAFEKMGDGLQDALVVDLEDLIFKDFQKQPNVTIK